MKTPGGTANPVEILPLGLHSCAFPAAGTPSMPDDIHFYEPANGHGLPHDPFNAIVGPRPIGWISSQDGQGRLNLAPYSFFNAFNYIPPIIGFSSVGRKDSLNNIEQTGEFAWNLATRPLAEQMNQSCATVPADVNEPGVQTMKIQLILALTLSVLAANTFAADGFDRTGSAVAADGYDRTGAATFAADGYDRTGSATVAEDGYDRTGSASIS